MMLKVVFCNSSLVKRWCCGYCCWC